MASGGLVYYDSSYVYNVFLSGGDGFFVPATTTSVYDILVVGGGGGGGAGHAGGGGAGGVLAFVAQTLTAGTQYAITVGLRGSGGSPAGEAGPSGSAAAYPNAHGNNGGMSKFGSLSAALGGGGVGPTPRAGLQALEWDQPEAAAEAAAQTL